MDDARAARRALARRAHGADDDEMAAPEPEPEPEDLTEEQQMQRLLGFGGFASTRGTRRRAGIDRRLGS